MVDPHATWISIQESTAGLRLQETSSLSAPPTTSTTNRNVPAETTSSPRRRRLAQIQYQTRQHPSSSRQPLCSRAQKSTVSWPVPKRLHLRCELSDSRQGTLPRGALLRDGRTHSIRLSPETVHGRRRRIVP